MNRKKTEKELMEENKRLKTENERLKKNVTFIKEKLKIQNEKLEDLLKDNNIRKYQEYRRQYELVLEERKIERASHKKEVENLKTTIQNLTGRINKNSSNSSIPSSSEIIFTKKKCVNTSREKTDRKSGGQLGHKGTGLTKQKAEELIKSGKVEHVIEEHVLDGADINSCECVVKYEIDIEIKTKVIEHRFYIKENKNEMPEEYNTDVQYGNNLKAFTAIEVNEGFISLNRTAKIINEITNNTINLSQGTIVNFNKELAMNSANTMESIKDALIKVGVLHIDETGLRVNGELSWLHTATTDLYTYYQVNEKRGKEGIKNMGILEYFVGVLVHDHFTTYYQYKAMTHAECNAHILRYLKQVIELFKRDGATKFLEFLVRINNEKKNIEKTGNSNFEGKKIEEIEKEYILILNNWKTEYERYIKGKKKNKSLEEEENLFKRLIEYKEEHLLFIKDFKVPFSNNLAEKALRMIKTKLKVSGCFRGKDKGSYFATIRSLFETTKKHGMNLHDTVRKVFNNENVEFVKA